MTYDQPEAQDSNPSSVYDAACYADLTHHYRALAQRKGSLKGRLSQLIQGGYYPPLSTLSTAAARERLFDMLQSMPDKSTLEESLFRDLYKASRPYHPIVDLLDGHVVECSIGPRRLDDFRLKANWKSDETLIESLIDCIPGAKLAFIQAAEKVGLLGGGLPGWAMRASPWSEFQSVLIPDADGVISHRVTIYSSLQLTTHVGAVDTLFVELQDLDPEDGYTLLLRLASPSENKYCQVQLGSLQKKFNRGIPTLANILLCTRRPAWRCTRGVLMLLLAMESLERKNWKRFMGRGEEAAVKSGAQIVTQFLPIQPFMDRVLDKAAEDVFELRKDAALVKSLRRDIAAKDSQLQQANRQHDCDMASLERNARHRDVAEARVRELETTISLERTAPVASETDTLVLSKAADDLAHSELVVSQLRDVIAAQKNEIAKLQSRVDSISTAGVAAATTAEQWIPETFDDLEAWIAIEMSDGRMVIHPRAIAAALESNFREPAVVYRALLALRDIYWPMKFGSGHVDYKAWRDALNMLRLDCSKTGNAAFRSQTAPFYRVELDGAPYTLDMHLKGNSAFDPRFALRIYFAVDVARKRIVVGAFPMHLPNRISN